METIIWVVHLIAALSVIGLVLLQHGKGADMGAAFGSGTSGSLFGVSGASNLLSRTTAIMVAVFFCTSLGLTYFSGHRDHDSSVVHQ
ncbi:MAG TPA: preprotein translocase subunit SecG, partial [Methylophilaceae bacterium]